MYTNKNKHITGYLSELTAQRHFVTQGWEIFIPTFTQTSCDFVAVKKEMTLRIQVKTAYWFTRPSGARYLQCTVRKGASASHSRYTKEDCDVIVIVFGDRIWKIPIEELPDTTNIILQKDVKHERRNYKQYNPDAWAETH
jgi:hypothetical protein